MKSFREALQGTGIPITAELSSPAASSVQEVRRQAGLLADFVDAIQLTENPVSEARISTLVLARMLIRNGIDAVPRISCRDHNKIALQSDLLGLRALGISSLVLIDGQAFPEAVQSKSVFDVRCPELVAMAQELNEEGRQDTAHEFVIGTSLTVTSPEPRLTTDHLLRRAVAGARFVQTQPCFDLEVLSRYMEEFVQAKMTWKFSVIVTLAPFPSVEMARWLAENNRHGLIPDNVIERLKNAASPETEGIEICADLMRDMARVPGVSGFNLLTLGKPEAVVAAIEASGLRQ